MYYSDVKKYYFSQIKDPEMDRLIAEFQSQQVTLEGYARAHQRCMDYAYEMCHKSGIANVNTPLAARKGVPRWNPGTGNPAGFRLEYIGERE